MADAKRSPINVKSPIYTQMSNGNGLNAYNHLQPFQNESSSMIKCIGFAFNRQIQ